MNQNRKYFLALSFYGARGVSKYQLCPEIDWDSFEKNINRYYHYNSIHCKVKHGKGHLIILRPRIINGVKKYIFFYRRDGRNVKGGEMIKIWRGSNLIPH